MRHRLIIAMLLSITFTSTAIGYTVVLKNGSKIEATLITEDDSMIRIRDTRGLEYALKKSSLDLESMTGINSQKEKPETKLEKRSETQAEKEVQTNVFTNDDIRRLRDFTEPGSVIDEKGEEPEVEEKPEKRKESNQEYPFLRSRSEKLRERISSLEKEYEQAELECSRSGGHTSTENIFDPSEKRMVSVKNTNCQKEDRLREELAKARDDLFDAEQEEGRQSPP